ncbi:MAG TPA: CAP domain-containing protein [Thermomicrobiales bacterium]|jgi:hypothetical protein
MPIRPRTREFAPPHTTDRAICAAPRPVRYRPRRALPLAFLALLILVSAFGAPTGHIAAATPFVDVAPNDPAATAIDQLYARGVIRGYPTTPPTFGPADTSRRAQMAALLGRAMGWDPGGTPTFTDRCNAGGCIDDELWGYIAALASRDVARGYDPATFAPFDNVLKQQVILFISRAKVQQGAWVRQLDNPRLYPGAADSSADHQDLVTYAFYAGAPPNAPATLDTAWDDFGGAATRGWFARALWQAYPEGKGTPIGDAPAPAPGSSIPTDPNTAAFAAEVLRLTNEQRQANGCAPLTANILLRNAAQKHAVDMAEHNYFSHTGLNGSGPSDRITAAGYSIRRWAENIAFGYQTPQDVMDGWMNSTGHRANILNCNLTAIGIGYYDSLWVQDFASPR